MVKSLRRNKTIIILVVIIALSVLATGLFFGISFSNNEGTLTPTSTPADYIGLPNIQFISINSSLEDTEGFIIDLQIKNVGPSTLNFDQNNILLNGRSITSIVGASTTLGQTTLVTNSSVVGTIILPLTDFSSGMTINTTIQDARHGISFSRLIILP